MEKIIKSDGSSSDTSWEYNNKGNYWDDFNLKYPDIKDENNDGIWDGPYEIPGSGNNQDNCPLVNPFENSKNIVDNSYHFYYLSQLLNRFPLLEQILHQLLIHI